MALNLIGEVDSIHERQKEFICDVLEKRGFKNCDVSVESMGSAGDNFMANIKRIVVSKNGKTFKMIAKLPPESRGILDAGTLFKNEHTIYREVFPKFKELQKNAGIPQKDWYKHAECYGTMLEAPHEVILLEDLKEKRFDILNRFKPMSNECVKLVLKNFAQLHSLSYAMKYQDPELYSDLKSNLADAYDGPVQKMEIQNQFAQKMEDDVLACLVDDKQKAAFKETMSKMHVLTKEFTEREKDSQYAVIQQGDGWMNNIMFTFENNQPSQCILIDYQMAKESNPMYDIMYMIFNSTETEQRIKHYNEFIDYYYSELDNYLSDYSLKVSSVYPRTQLNADMKRNVKLILAISIIIANLIVKDIADSTKLQETMKTATEEEDTFSVMMEKNPQTEILFQKRIAGLAKSVIELELI